MVPRWASLDPIYNWSIPSFLPWGGQCSSAAALLELLDDQWRDGKTGAVCQAGSIFNGSYDMTYWHGQSVGAWMAAGETEKEGDVHMQQLGNSLKGVLSVYEGLCNLKRVKLFPPSHTYLLMSILWDSLSCFLWTALLLPWRSLDWVEAFLGLIYTHLTTKNNSSSSSIFMEFL